MIGSAQGTEPTEPCNSLPLRLMKVVSLRTRVKSREYFVDDTELLSQGFFDLCSDFGCYRE